MKNSYLSVSRMARLMGQSLARVYSFGRFFLKVRRNSRAVGALNRISNLARSRPSTAAQKPYSFCAALRIFCATMGNSRDYFPCASQSASICSSVLPLVSGTMRAMKTAARMAIAP